MKILDRGLFLMRRRKSDWIMWDVCVPVFFILLPVIRYTCETEEAFAKSFGGGDLILYSLVLLVGLRIELSEIRAINDPARFGDRENQTTVLAVLMAGFYMYIRLDFLDCEFSHSESGIPSRISGYGWFSVGCAVFAIGFSWFMFWRTFYDLMNTCGGSSDD